MEELLTEALPFLNFNDTAPVSIYCLATILPPHPKTPQVGTSARELAESMEFQVHESHDPQLENHKGELRRGKAQWKTAYP